MTREKSGALGRSGSRRRGALMVIAAAAAATPFAHAAVQSATWKPGTGNWDVPARWSPAVVPNNAVDTYNVFIDGGNAAVSVVTLNVAPTINSLTIDNGDTLACGNFSLALSFTGNGEIKEIANHPGWIVPQTDPERFKKAADEILRDAGVDVHLHTMSPTPSRGTRPTAASFSKATSS